MDNKRLPHVALTLRLKPAVGRLLDDTARKMGISKTAVVVVALRDLARKESVALPTEEESDDGTD